MDGSYSSISLGEFIAQGYLSRADIQFEGEIKSDGTISQPLPSSNNESSAQTDDNKLHSLNATKLSLMLAERFAKHLGGDAGAKVGNHAELALLGLDRIYVNLRPANTVPQTESSRDQNGILPHSAEAGRGTSTSALDDEIDIDFLVSTVFDDHDLEQSGNDPQSKAEGSPETTWTVLGIDFLRAPNVGVSTQSLTSMQVLGNHIRAIYSRVNRQASSLTNQRAIPDREDSSGNRSPKLRMYGEDSLFSTLSETGEYPISVCRLLSDMIDAGGSGDPFETFKAVVQDLEQMSNHPEIFLHDPDNDFVSSTLHFGQRHYGRVKELTKMLEIPTRLEQDAGEKANIGNNGARSDSSAHPGASEAVFVSGVGGSGKSHFVQNVGSFLMNLGWIVKEAKFKRELEHGSREIFMSLFENLVAGMVTMRNGGNEADVDYSTRAANAISGALDSASISSLATFVPSIQELMPGVDKSESLPAEAETSHWQLVFLLSKLVGAILSLERYIMICLDNLQWCDSMTLTLIKEIIVSIGKNHQGRQHFLFVGMYRSDEITDSHPFAGQLAALHDSSDVSVTEIELSSLSSEDIADMIMSEVRLPKRLVCGLAGVVHKKTSGHALFVVQLMNSLVRDSMISYSPRKRRFDWDENKIGSLKTMDSVASLIVSNLSLLQVDALQSLRVLSCFGVQIPQSLLKIFADCRCVPEGGIESYLPGLVEGGVVMIAGPSIYFSHDLIQQHVYESIPVDERQKLHLEIGTFIAEQIDLDSTLSAKSVEAGIEGLKLGEPNNSQASTFQSFPLVAIATNQINFAGPKSVSDRAQQIRFSKWNHQAGKDAAIRSNFQAALYYYKCGIAFLGDGLWLEDSHDLCHGLFDGAGFALFANGDFSLAAEQAKSVIDHVQFEESLESQYLLLRSLDSLGRYSDGVEKGLELLRKLNISIPDDPSPSSVKNAMNETTKRMSSYSFHQITNMKRIVDSKKRSINKLLCAMIVSFFRSNSPYLPLAGCAIVNYSLQNGVCVESANGFLVFGFFKVALEEKYEEGRYYGSLVYELLEKFGNQATSMVEKTAAIRADCMTTQYLNFLYYPLKQLAFRNFKLYERAMSFGDPESAMYCLYFSLLHSFFGGEKLSLLSSSLNELIKSMMKHSKEGAKLALVYRMLTDELTGNSSNGTFPDFGGGGITDEQSLLADALFKKNTRLVEEVHSRRFFSAFWSGDYDEASKCSREVLALPCSKLPKIQTTVLIFFSGLVAFQKYRDGEGEEWLDEGKKVFDKMEVWSKNSKANFENKLLLIEAEHHASMCNIVAAKMAYEASVRSARDHGLVHEQGLACELYGKFLTSVIETNEALFWFRCSHSLYVQWGATAKAENLWNSHNLGCGSMIAGNVEPYAMNKHGRGW